MNERMSETIGELIQLQSKNFQISLDESGVFLLFLWFFSALFMEHG